ncbi:unnamed protein product [Camellia sinensis]
MAATTVVIREKKRPPKADPNLSKTISVASPRHELASQCLISSKTSSQPQAYMVLERKRERKKEKEQTSKGRFTATSHYIYVLYVCMHVWRRAVHSGLIEIIGSQTIDLSKERDHLSTERGNHP